MKTLLRLFCCIVMAGCIFCGSGSAMADSGGSLPDRGSDAWQIVVNDIAGQVVVLLLEDNHFRVLGIGDIEGDHNSLAEALTAAIKAATDFHLVERADLNKLLKEQSIQLSPLSDPNGLVEPGKIYGVEGLLIGRVVKKFHSPFYSSLVVFLKLDDVETGNVVFAGNFEASYIPPMTWYLGIFVLALFLFLMLRNISRKKKKRFLYEYSQKEAADRQAIEADLKKSRDNLNRAHELLQNAEKSEAAMLVRRNKEELGQLLQKLQQGAVVHPDAVDKAMVKELDRHNKTMKGQVEKVLASSEKVLDVAGKDNIPEGVLNTMATHIKDAANTAYDRQAGTS